MMCSTVVLLVSATLVAGVSSYFDIEDEFQLLEPPNTHLIGAPQCRTASLFALIGALEIAQQRTTGIQINFSEQEIIDCQYSGCMGASLEEYVNWLAVHDRLAPADHYNAYRARQFPCSSALAPDALSQIKVAGVKHIQLEEFEEAIARYGSVLACIDTSSSSCPVYRVYEDGIINGFASDKCNHRVLVVGYTEKYYRVRNSYGPDWGEEGYFRILRGGNVCGIESHLAVLEIEERIETKKVDNVTGCPRTYPVYCNATKTCRSKKQTCVEIDERAMAAEQHEEVLRDRESRLQQNSRNIRNALCEDNPSYSCSALSAYCQVQKIQSICPATCQVCTSACIDVEEYDGECEELREFCTHSNAVKAKCAYTCGMDPQDCGTVTENVNLLVKYNRPPLGECYKPRVKNGKVLNKGRLTTGQKLVILCAPGYVLSGEANYCQIQNIYKPDSRRLQTCVPTAGEAFTGQGMDYSGTVSTTVGGEKCDNWQKLAHLGIFDSIEQGRSLARVGNHNFCRNYKEDLMGPWCLVNGRRSYCFAFPGCGGDLCSSHNMQNSYPYCTSSFTGQECALSHSGRENKVAWYWKNCRHMCCAASGC